MSFLKAKKDINTKSAFHKKFNQTESYNQRNLSPFRTRTNNLGAQFLYPINIIRKLKPVHTLYNNRNSTYQRLKSKVGIGRNRFLLLRPYSFPIHCKKAPHFFVFSSKKLSSPLNTQITNKRNLGTIWKFTNNAKLFDFTFVKLNKLLFQTRVTNALSNNLIYHLQNELQSSTSNLYKMPDYVRKISTTLKTNSWLYMSLSIPTKGYVLRSLLSNITPQSTKIAKLPHAIDSIAALAQQRNLSSLNIVFKKTIKKYFSFYTYTISPNSLEKNPSRIFIPELKFATRGFYSTNYSSTLLTKSLFVTELPSTLDQTLINLQNLNLPSLPVSQLKSFTSTKPKKILPLRNSSSQKTNFNTLLKPQRKTMNKIQFPTRINNLQTKFTTLENLKPRILKRKKSAQWQFRRLKSRLRRKSFHKRTLLRRINRLNSQFLTREQRTFRRLTIKSIVRKKFKNRKPIFINNLPKQPTLIAANYEYVKSILKSPLFSQITWSLSHEKTWTLKKTSTTSFSVTPQTQFLDSIPLQSLFYMWKKPLILKTATLNYTHTSLSNELINTPSYSNKWALKLQNQILSYLFGPKLNSLKKLNLWIVPSINYTIRRKLLRNFSHRSFTADLVTWYYTSLIRFIENCTGQKVALNFGPFVENALTFEDKAKITLWGTRVTGFQKILGHRIFVQEAVMLVALSLKLKDPTFLANWIRGMLQRMSFWKYRVLFRYLKFLIRHIFKPHFNELGFRGFKLRLKGKISVAGNARTRTLVLRVGDTSHSKMDNRVAYDLSYVNTFTGVLGFKLWFFY